MSAAWLEGDSSSVQRPILGSWSASAVSDTSWDIWDRIWWL